MEAARAAPGGRRKNLSLKLAPRARRQKETFDAAFEGFYREHVAEVYQYALAVLGNSADAADAHYLRAKINSAPKARIKRLFSSLIFMGMVITSL